ncbi:MAG: fibrobacter succinogenes major paralogous domain-containing protein [Bacteroidales bacterium]|nr:fibrobacter succinogenes major paralogous domain-containing protein [Bacteroidales bacterium]
MEDRHKTVRHKTVGGASGACVVIASVAKQSSVNCLNHDFHDLRIDRIFMQSNHAHHLNHIKITVQTITHRISQILLLALSLATASAQEVAWKKNFGGSALDAYYALATVSDGVVAVGNSDISSFGTGDWVGVTGKGGQDAIIIKYDHSGNVAWNKHFGGSSSDIYYAVTTISDGVVAVGWSISGSFGNGDWTGVLGKGGNDAIIVKYDNDGEVVWKKNFGGSDSDLYWAVTAVADGIVAVGYSWANSFGSGDWAGVSGKGATDAIIVKYDNNGNVVWKKNFGSGGNDYYQAVATVSDGIVAVGYSTAGSFGTGDWMGISGKGSSDAIIVKYDHSGDVVWKKNFGGSGSDLYWAVTAVADGIAAVGYSQASSFGTGDWTGVTGKGGDDAIIVKYDNDGDVMWKKNFGGSGIDGYNAVTDVSDGIVAVGYSTAGSFGTGDWTGVTGKGFEDAIIVKYDNNGDIEWKKNFGGNDANVYQAITTVSDAVVAAGISSLNAFGNGDWEGIPGKGDDDAIIVKYFDSPPSAAVATHADFSCPGEVVVTYDLESDLPVDVTLYYSPNQCDWLEAITVTGDLFAQTTGTGKTITWYNYNDNVRYGKFFFKVEAPEQCVPDCVMINGVCWATRNLDVGGGFVASSQEYGAYFQWGRKSDGHEDSSSPTVTGPISGGDLDGDGQPAGSYIGKFIANNPSPYDWRTPSDNFLWDAGTYNAPIKTVNDPCPCGWRLPTLEELNSLIDLTYVKRNWIPQNGVYGLLFTDNNTNNTIFLPAGGHRDNTGGGFSNVGTQGSYWSSGISNVVSYSRGLYFASGFCITGQDHVRSSGYSIRCVAE